MPPPPLCLDSGHAIRRRHVQAATNVRRIVPEQATDGQVPESDVSPERVRERGAVSGHFAEPLESDVRCGCDLDEYPEPFA